MTKRRAGIMGIAFAFGAAGCAGEGEGGEAWDEAAVAQEVEITAPAMGATVGAGPITIRLAVRGVEIRPAGTDEPNTGHHHLFVDRDITSPGATIPAEDGIIHLGGGQTEQEVTLEPGEHTIIAVLGDFEHVRLAAVKTDTVRVVVD